MESSPSINRTYPVRSGRFPRFLFVARPDLLDCVTSCDRQGTGNTDGTGHGGIRRTTAATSASPCFPRSGSASCPGCVPGGPPRPHPLPHTRPAASPSKRFLQKHATGHLGWLVSYREGTISTIPSMTLWSASDRHRHKKARRGRLRAGRRTDDRQDKMRRPSSRKMPLNIISSACGLLALAMASFSVIFRSFTRL